jgi:hypothetical protein
MACAPHRFNGTARGIPSRVRGAREQINHARLLSGKQSFARRAAPVFPHDVIVLRGFNYEGSVKNTAGEKP